MTRILITGANGFVGRALVRQLRAAGRPLCAVSRRPEFSGAGIETRIVDDIADTCEQDGFFDSVDTVVHLAARVHMMGQSGAGEMESYLRENTEITARLARAAAAAKVRRLIFLSSIKVNGEECTTAYTEASPPTPMDSYGISKWRAEQALAEIAADTGLETVILRPPLVYGPDVRANFLSLLRLADSGIPLPLGGLNRNTRSLIYLGNLVSAIIRAVDHADAAGRTFLLRDGEDLSTAALVGRIRTALGRPARLIPVPAALIGAVARLAGRNAAVRRLGGSLTINDGAIRRELGWRPPFTLDQGLAATASWYRVRRTTDH